MNTSRVPPPNTHKSAVRAALASMLPSIEARDFPILRTNLLLNLDFSGEGCQLATRRKILVTGKTLGAVSCRIPVF